jgi:preprotein translocase subunit SecA
VESHNFDIRKHLLEYDDVMNKQREVIYSQRREVLAGENVKQVILDMIPELVHGIVDEFVDEKVPSEDWQWRAASERMRMVFGFPLEWPDQEKKELGRDTFQEKLLQTVMDRYDQREREIGEENMRHLERVILLQMVDTHWKEHLLHMDHLKEGIGLRGYGQKNPLDEYKREGFSMFMDMIQRVKQQTVGTIFRIQLAREDQVEELEREQRQQKPPVQLKHGEAEEAPKPVSREGDKIGRNALCPCGSGKKYKRCCGKSE